MFLHCYYKVGWGSWQKKSWLGPHDYCMKDIVWIYVVKYDVIFIIILQLWRHSKLEHHLVNKYHYHFIQCNIFLALDDGIAWKLVKSIPQIFPFVMSKATGMTKGHIQKCCETKCSRMEKTAKSTGRLKERVLYPPSRPESNLVSLKPACFRCLPVRNIVVLQILPTYTNKHESTQGFF